MVVTVCMYVCMYVCVFVGSINFHTHANTPGVSTRVSMHVGIGESETTASD